jgi:hypothetical protein
MRAVKVNRSAETARLVVILLLTATVGACSDPRGKLYPVTGKVSLNHTPLGIDGAAVRFTPDVSRGNGSKFDAFGAIQSDGTFTLYTHDREGVALGWYRVAVTVPPVTPARLEPPNPNRKKVSLPSAPIPIRYANPDRSGLAVEVVETPNAGHYDLHLQK